jgi:hypothetical protein
LDARPVLLFEPNLFGECRFALLFPQCQVWPHSKKIWLMITR